MVFMADKVSKKKRSEIMSKIRCRETNPEKIFEKALKEKCLKFKKHYGKHKIDFVFPREKIAVFVDGCFWHGCPKHYNPPKSNKKYWSWKVSYNKKRDRKISRDLENEGWTVIRIWEHSIPKRTNYYIKKLLQILEMRKIADFQK